MHQYEYVEQFGLSPTDLNGRVLDYGCVPETTQESMAGFAHPVTRCAPVSNDVLPFADFSFDYALCPYYLFTEDDALGVDAHLQVIRELARVAQMVRIFPLIHSNGLPSPILGPVLLGLQQENYGVEVRDVASTTQLKSNAMLLVWAQLCHVSLGQ